MNYTLRAIHRYVANCYPAWKLHYDGYGQGVGHHDPGQTGGLTLTTVYDELKQKHHAALDSVEILESFKNEFTSKLSSFTQDKLGVLTEASSDSSKSSDKSK